MDKNEKKFEEKINDLENLINELENGNVDLEDSIEKYVEAMNLAKECDQKLKNIEERVSKIISENGEINDFDLEG